MLYSLNVYFIAEGIGNTAGAAVAASDKQDENREVKIEKEDITFGEGGYPFGWKYSIKDKSDFISLYIMT